MDRPHERIEEKKVNTALNNPKAHATRLERKTRAMFVVLINVKSARPGGFYGLVKILKLDVPVRPIIDCTSCGTTKVFQCPIKTPLEDNTKPYQ